MIGGPLGICYGWKGFLFIKKSQHIKSRPRIWNKEVFRNIEEVKNKIALDLDILNRVEESQELDQMEWEKRWKLKIEYEQILKNEKIKWRQKSRFQ